MPEDKKISEYTELTQTDVATDDGIAIVDTSATETKKFSWSSVKGALKTYFDTIYAAITDPSRVRAYMATTDQTISNDTLTKIQLNAKDYDSQDEFDEVTNFRFTAKKTGYYLILGSLYWNSAVDQCRLSTYIYKNGSACTVGVTNASGTSVTFSRVSDIQYLNVNDYIELWGYQNSGGNISISANTIGTFMAIHKLS